MIEVESRGEIVVRPAHPDDVLALLPEVPNLAHLDAKNLSCLSGAEWVEAPAGTLMSDPTQVFGYFWVVAKGALRIWKFDTEGARMLLLDVHGGDTFGEVPLLMGLRSSAYQCEVLEDTKAVRLPEDSFWILMGTCPMARRGILMDMARRHETHQAVALHREKLISLGTLAAGLMHELNNPGAAARRAAAQLRDNVTRLQSISLRLTHTQLSPEQLQCVSHLQEEIFDRRSPASLNTLEQSDREEELSEWLEGIEVENAWRLAPTLVSAGLEREELDCARHQFAPQAFSDILNYLESLISSVQLVGTVEESIGRVTDLVTAVKKYAYNDRGREQQIDVAESLHNTLTILGHKFRHKQITVERNFEQGLPAITSRSGGLTQVWTNILDNAIDAAPEHGRVRLRVWKEDQGGDETVCVGIEDNGSGIPKEYWQHIYEPFFTTKEVGHGTGLGLEIAHRIVVSHFGGEITFSSEPGRTEFVVRLPVTPPSEKRSEAGDHRGAQQS